MERVLGHTARSILMSLDTPMKVQAYIDTLRYDTSRRIAIVNILKVHNADCLEAACLAWYIFKLHRIRAFIMDLACRGNDEDHVVCVFRHNKLYGAVGQSKYLGLRHRNPVYRTLRELAMSYFDNYFNFKGEYDLISRSVPMYLKEDMMFCAESTRIIERKLDTIRHIQLVPKRIRLPLVGREKFRRELIKRPKNVRLASFYAPKHS